jgi:hypothetical protein
MREYAEEGIEHFYFMMLQKDEVSESPFGSTRSLWYANRGLISCCVAVHRRNQARWHWPFRESLLCSKLLRRKVDDRAAYSDGHFLKSCDKEG